MERTEMEREEAAAGDPAVFSSEVEDREAPARGASLAIEAGDDFVVTGEVRAIADRALGYLRAGYPVHFSGPAGTGKTTFALHVAATLGRPVTLLHGDDEFGSSDLIGGHVGFRRSKLVDNFVHSVMKTEENASALWVDNRLTQACRRGETLIYDEFTRSRPEANNVLLSILAERVLALPRLRAGGASYLEVHPGFRAIFTSNPEEYAGVHKTADALLDRLVTIRIRPYGRATEVAIVQAKSGIARQDASAIVDLARALRGERGTAGRRSVPMLRGAIVLARMLARTGARARRGDATFVALARDLLARDEESEAWLGEAIAHLDASGSRARSARKAGRAAGRAARGAKLGREPEGAAAEPRDGEAHP